MSVDKDQCDLEEMERQRDMYLHLLRTLESDLHRIIDMHSTHSEKNGMLRLLVARIHAVVPVVYSSPPKNVDDIPF